VLAWEVSNTLETDFCLRTLDKAVAVAGTVPEIFNTDQGCQFTSSDWAGHCRIPCSDKLFGKLAAARKAAGPAVYARQECVDHADGRIFGYKEFLGNEEDDDAEHKRQGAETCYSRNKCFTVHGMLFDSGNKVVGFLLKDNAQQEQGKGECARSGQKRYPEAHVRGMCRHKGREKRQQGNDKQHDGGFQFAMFTHRDLYEVAGSGTNRVVGQYGFLRREPFACIAGAAMQPFWGIIGAEKGNFSLSGI